MPPDETLSNSLSKHARGELRSPCRNAIDSGAHSCNVSGRKPAVTFTFDLSAKRALTVCSMFGMRSTLFAKSKPPGYPTHDGLVRAAYADATILIGDVRAFDRNESRGEIRLIEKTGRFVERKEPIAPEDAMVARDHIGNQCVQRLH